MVLSTCPSAFLSPALGSAFLGFLQSPHGSLSHPPSSFLATLWHLDELCVCCSTASHCNVIPLTWGSCQNTEYDSVALGWGLIFCTWNEPPSAVAADHAALTRTRLEIQSSWLDSLESTPSCFCLLRLSPAPPALWSLRLGPNAGH